MLGAVEWGIYPFISMGTITSIMLLFTQSSRIRRENVGSHAIVFKSFGPFTLKHNPGVLKLKRVCSAFKSLCFRPRKRWSSVNDRRNRSKSSAF